ncbi:MAG: hypothetical protein ACRDD2_13125 [Sarcina sp.]
MEGGKIVKYALLGIGVYVVLNLAFHIFGIVFNILFKVLALVAIIAFIGYLVKKK